MKSIAKIATCCLVFSALAAGEPPIACSAESKPADRPTGGVKRLKERIEQLEAAVGRSAGTDRWYDRIQISGLVEVEAAYSREDDETETTDTSDLDLATVELNVDAKIDAHVDAHVMLKYETDTPDGKDSVFIDEGFITVRGPAALPAFLIAGRQYLPFGDFPSVFVTDPTTLTLGETNEGAVVVGCQVFNEVAEIVAAAFNGRASQAGKDDAVDSYMAAVTVAPLNDVTMGASYTSNLAGSDSFNDEMVDAANLEATVAGWSVFAEATVLERFTLMGEYLAAVDGFAAGEVYDAADSRQRQPKAWNMELAVSVLDNLELGARYGGSDDGGAAFLPETQYGCVVNWGIYGCNLALEYLHDEFENNAKDVDTLTAQLAVEF